jgi:hypothetical protein
MQGSPRHPPRDGIPIEADPGQLRPRDHPMLPAGDPRNPLSPRNWWGIVPFFGTNPHHFARVAGRLLPVGSLCNGAVTLTGARGP